MEFVIEVWIEGKEEVVAKSDRKLRALPCMHMTHYRVGQTCCAR